MLINEQEEHIDEYPYDPEYKKLYILTLLRCLQKAFLKYMRDIVWVERENGETDLLTILTRCFKEFAKLNIQRNRRSISKQQFAV